MSPDIKKTTVSVIIRKKDGILWEGEADSLTSTNKVGVFDVLPNHAHFVGLIEQYVIIRGGKEEKRWDIDRGILSVKDGIIEAFLGY